MGLVIRSRVGNPLKVTPRESVCLYKSHTPTQARSQLYQASPLPQISTHPRPKVEEHVDRTRRKSALTAEFRRTSAGVWDVYEQIPRRKFGVGVPWISNLARNIDVVEDLPFVWRAMKDLLRIRACWYYLSLLVLVKILASIQPAVILWCVISRVPPLQSLTTSAQVHRSLAHHRAYFQNLFLVSHQRSRSRWQ